MDKQRRTAFTLIELLVVVAIIALLTAILVPAMTKARESANKILCSSNLHGLAMANLIYADDYGGFFVPGAPDIDVGFGGTIRWHGVRVSPGVSPNPAENTFDPTKGPLSPYFLDGEMKRCPSFEDFVELGSRNAYESGAGGFGYNNTYVGTRTRWGGGITTGARTTEIKRSGSTTMFADSAMLQADAHGEYITEESFVYPPYFLNGKQVVPEWGLAVPSIHFRHNGLANIAWCDGHVDSGPMSFSRPQTNPYGGYPEQWNIGWYGPQDNSLFGEP